MIKVALIRPAPSVVIQEYDRPGAPSIGLAYLASFLKANHVEALTIDAKFDRPSQKETENALLMFVPNVLGFTAMTHEITYVAQVASELKKLFPNSITVIGGPHATVAALETLMQFPVFDVAVIGEGELTLLELAKLIDEYNFETKGSKNSRMTKGFLQRLELVKGIAWRSKNEIRLNEPRELISDLDSCHSPITVISKEKSKTTPSILLEGALTNAFSAAGYSGTKYA